MAPLLRNREARPRDREFASDTAQDALSVFVLPTFGLIEDRDPRIGLVEVQAA